MKRFYAELSKVEDQDDGTIKVFGYASSGAEDSDGEIVEPDAIKAALPDYMRWGAVREMHQPKAAGTAIEARVEDDGRTWFGAHVVDSEAVRKVKAGVYKGFSIGGKVTARDQLNKSVIKGLKLVEVSLVDRPANPEATIELWKGEAVGASEADEATTTPAGASEAAGDPAVTAVDALAAMLNKGEITPERLVELAKGAIAKESDPPAPSSLPEGASSSAEPVGSDPAPAAGEKVEKGLYTVGAFASLLSSVGSLAMDSTAEAAWEGDGSPVPGQLRDWFAQGAAILAAMTAEESAEMLASLQLMAAQKAAAAGDLAKAGARFSAATKAVLADVHKAMQDCCAKFDGLGYATKDDDSGDGGADTDASADDVSSAAGTGDLTKALRAAAGVPDDADLVDAVSKLAAQRDALQKRVADLEAMPAPGKAFLKALEKAQDVGTPLEKSDALPELPENATPEERAKHEIKKVLRSGGTPFIPSR
ncbi:MAG: XkdF-like putative serine protease domain-containing protein [Burkholderiales bacterium]|jgi:phage head maturation protease